MKKVLRPSPSFRKSPCQPCACACACTSTTPLKGARASSLAHLPLRRAFLFGFSGGGIAFFSSMFGAPSSLGAPLGGGGGLTEESSSSSSSSSFYSFAYPSSWRLNAARGIKVYADPADERKNMSVTVIVGQTAFSTISDASSAILTSSQRLDESAQVDARRTRMTANGAYVVCIRTNQLVYVTTILNVPSKNRAVVITVQAPAEDGDAATVETTNAVADSLRADL